jgi:hypothetical protein
MVMTGAMKDMSHATACETHIDSETQNPDVSDLHSAKPSRNR